MTKITSSLLLEKFPFKPTFDQAKLFTVIDDFLDKDEEVRSVFLLKGFAGTGKTTFISTLVKVLPKIGYKSILLAPTGRAAKVMALYSRKKALTIHKKIYRQIADSYIGNIVFERQKNYHEDTVFIVDEASMIADTREFGRNSLLHDLLDFVFESNSNKLIIIGDEAQLPPIGTPTSPALDKEHLENFYHTTLHTHTLSGVTRQAENSGILANATHLREQLEENPPQICFTTQNYPDIFRMTGERLEDGLRYAYNKFGKENTIILTRSNKTAVQYNTFVRQQINYSESEIEKGDILMVLKNNYTLLDDNSKVGFIANGDFVEVVHIGKEESVHNLRFAQLTLRLIDYPDEPEFTTKVILNTLYSHASNLTAEESKALYESVLKDYFWIKSKREQMEQVKKDPYLNALQVKFAYALTCHKAQGGQWDAVFIDQGFPMNGVDVEFVRWTYTAITRASKEVFLVNFWSQLFK